MQKSKTILVVDDKANVRSLLREYLAEQGFRVITAENGRIALFPPRQEKLDLILLDIMMPEMDGNEFMRAHRKEADTPIILLTARLEEMDKVLGLELGADDYVTKPSGKPAVRRTWSHPAYLRMCYVAKSGWKAGGTRCFT